MKGGYMYPSYLIHFNRVHDPKTGRFYFGDGDGDGIRNDHANANSSPRKNSGSYNRTEANKQRLSKIFDNARSANKGNPIDRSTYDDHINMDTGKYDPNRTFVDDAKLSGRQYQNASTRFDMKLAINRGNFVNGSSFVETNSDNWADEQKLSGTETGEELVRRHLGYAIVDMTEEDEEEKRKKKTKITQRYWRQGNKTS